MREIKFRAWDKEENKMVSSFTLQDIAAGESIQDIGAPCYEVMQYTGLKDKNGVEIWEGDILATKSVCAFVYWCEEEACFMTELPKAPIKYAVDDTWKEVGEAMIFTGPIDIVALHSLTIGDIYQNPELLKN